MGLPFGPISCFTGGIGVAFAPGVLGSTGPGMKRTPPGPVSSVGMTAPGVMTYSGTPPGPRIRSNAGDAGGAAGGGEGTTVLEVSVDVVDEVVLVLERPCSA